MRRLDLSIVWLLREAKTTLRSGILLLAFLLGGAGSALAVNEDIAAKVQAGIDRALASKTQDAQQEAFDSIVRLGCAAVPSIVEHLDDRRELPLADLRLDNGSPTAFEAFRQYGPEVVTDALAAILNHITLWDCGFIFNGAPESQRAETVQCWQKFVRDTPVRNCGSK